MEIIQSLSKGAELNKQLVKTKTRLKAEESVNCIKYGSKHKRSYCFESDDP